MRFQIIFFTTILIFTIFLTGCPGPTPPNSNSVLNTANGSTNEANNTNAPITAPTRKPDAPTENNAPTLAPVVKGYFEALKKKDDAALRKVLSQSFVKQLEEDMKEEKKTGLAAYVAETEDLKTPVEVRNEKIDGDKASAEVKGGTYVNWTKANFVKEDGVWKWTNQFDDNKAVSQSTSNSNTAK